MTAFPALTPNERIYDLGEKPVSEYRGEGAVAVLFRNGSVRVGQRLQLPFLNRSPSEVEQIWNHYYDQQNATFTVPSQVWCGHAAGATIADAGLQWKYIERPEPSRVAAGIYSITVTIMAVGINLSAPAAGALRASGAGCNIIGTQSAPLPQRPTPVPDPPVLPPVVTQTAPATGQLPVGTMGLGATIELRYATAGLPAPGEIGAGAAIELRYATGGLLEPAGMAMGEQIDLSEDP